MPNNKPRIKVLYLEDNKYDRKIFSSVFSSYLKEIEFEIAKDKEEYLNYLSEYQPQIIVSDFNLPDISGIEAYDYAKVVLENFSFFIFSSYLTDYQVKKCIQNGINRVIMKDEIKQLILQVENAVNSIKAYAQHG